ncbi:hypothetical protein BTN50_0627 [Candidatus Enterovibrio altilux]|uniref:Uncharacterized protein n=1 Tax=Candidatus Enterovibrio altilux TaxID=1927128 RepID=A0A291B801_9GAMM|nr:hypothetical protein BTN50_0627 [Candidatus Enterovibrio luxaltus]
MALINFVPSQKATQRDIEPKGSSCPHWQNLRNNKSIKEADRVQYA